MLAFSKIDGGVGIEETQNMTRRICQKAIEAGLVQLPACRYPKCWVHSEEVAAGDCLPLGPS